MKATDKQRSMLRCSVRRLSEALGQSEEAVELYIKTQLDIESFVLDREEMSVVIDYVKGLEDALKKQKANDGG